MSSLNFGLGKAKRALLAAAFCVTGLGAAQATPVVYNFEAFSDSDVLTNQIAGLSFSNTTVLTAGISLNELEFPPISGSNVVFDSGGALTIDFASPVFSVGGHFSYVTGLSFSAYDSLNNLLGTQLSSFGSNLLVSGDVGSMPNELLSFSSVGGLISRVVITGNVAGGSFVMDDLAVDAGTTVPEPMTLALVASVLVAGSLPGGWLRRRKQA